MIRLLHAMRPKSHNPEHRGSYLRDKSGNIAMMFGLLLVPMIGVVGLAVDFGQVLTVRNKLQVAADAAVLQAAGVARDLIQAGNGSDAATEAALGTARSMAENLFKAHANQMDLTNYTFDVKLNKTGQLIQASGNYTVESDNFIAGIFGQSSYSSTGTAESSSSIPSFVDVYIAMDVSQSMGLGATQDDMRALYQKTGCVFGCHVPQTHQSVSNSSVAKANNIELRIDVLRKSVQKMIDTAEKDSEESAAYRFGLYTMGADPDNVNEPLLNELTPINGNYTVLDQKAAAIDLGPNDYRGQGDSYFTYLLGKLRPKVPASGDGKSQTESRKFLFIVTDGLQDVVNRTDVTCTPGSPGNHCMGVIDPYVCKGFKDKKVTVGVLYTTFLPIYDRPDQPWNTTLQHDYVNLVINNGLAPQIAPKLKECATPGWFYEAADSASIDAAMKSLFDQITITPTLTN